MPSPLWTLDIAAGAGDELTKRIGTSREDYLKYVQGRFEELVFSPADLEKATRECVNGYIDAVAEREEVLLADIDADLEDLPARAFSVPRSERSLPREYSKLTEELLPLVAKDLGVDIATKVGSLIAQQVAEEVARRVLVALASRLGATAAIHSVGLASSGPTLGASIIAALIVDIGVEWLLEVSGHDPKKQVSDKIDATLDRIRSTLVEGGDEGKTQGLRQELKKLHSLKSTLRRQVLRRLILEGPRS